MKKLSFIDKTILASIGKEFPLEENLLKKLAHSLGYSEQLLKSQLELLYKNGIIRDIMIPFNWRQFGYKSSLFALSVPSSKIKIVKDALVGFSGVTHCYLRKAKLNIWFTFIYKNTNEKSTLVNKLKTVNIANIVELPAEKVIKLDMSGLL